MDRKRNVKITFGCVRDIQKKQKNFGFQRSHRISYTAQTYLLGTTHKPTRKHFANLNSKTLTLFNSNSPQYPIHTYIFCSEGTTTKSNYLYTVWSPHSIHYRTFRKIQISKKNFIWFNSNSQNLHFLQWNNHKIEFFSSNT